MNTEAEALADEVKHLAVVLRSRCIEYGMSHGDEAMHHEALGVQAEEALCAAIDRLAALASKPDAAPARTSEAIHPCGRGYMLDLFDDYADATADGYWDERAAAVAKRIVEAMTGEMQEHGDASSAAPAGALNSAGETPTEHAHRWATELAVSMARKFYPEVTQWKPLPDLLGVITQIDNMTTGLGRAGLSEMNAVQGHEAGRATQGARTEGEASS